MSIVNAIGPRERPTRIQHQALAEVQSGDYGRWEPVGREVDSLQQFSDYSDAAARLSAALSRKRAYFGFKRAIDIAGAAAGLVFLFPVLLLIAIAIKLESPGPVLYSQRRHGWRGQPFRIFKFRTMYANRCDTSGVQQALSGDDRVSPFGRFLRRMNLDELPQLWNVLRGDMSLVGPRPHAIGMRAAGRLYEELVPNYGLRLIVRPGITGLAQVSGFRGPTIGEYESRKRIEYDVTYIRRCSSALDTIILFKTIVREFCRGSGT